MKDLIQNILNKLGYQVRKFPDPPAVDLERRSKLLKTFNINKILDVGANTGQYAQLIRKLGFEGEIISFEPMKVAFAELVEASASDIKWKAENFVLGDKEITTIINIAGNSISSSIFEMLPAHLNAAPHSAYVDKETVRVRTLDSVFLDYVNSFDRVLLKIDVQGFEKNVLEGAKHSLPQIAGIQLEMSLVHLYSGGILFEDMLTYLNGKGFELYSLENVFWDVQTGQLLCVDGIFFQRGKGVGQR